MRGSCGRIDSFETNKNAIGFVQQDKQTDITFTDPKNAFKRTRFLVFRTVDRPIHTVNGYTTVIYP